MATIATERSVPSVCLRCNEPLLLGQPTEQIPLIPRWGWTSTAHLGCEYGTPELWSVEFYPVEPDEGESEVGGV